MITDHLFTLAAEQPDRSFIVFGDRTTGYGEMAGLVTAYADRLRQAGISEGQTVALICGNRPAFLVAWFALSELGAITVPLNTSLVGDGLRYTLEQSEAVALLIEPELLESKQNDLAELARMPRTLLLDGEVEMGVGGGERRRLAKIGPGTANSILYTSGTTGLPKGAVIPHGAYEAAGTDMARSLELTADDRILVFLPLFHANPQMYAVMSALETAATLILLPRFSASEFFAEARRHRATGFTYVGTVLSILDKRNPGAHRDHGLRWCVGGGAPKAVWSAVEERFGVAVRELYGMTETGGWVTMNTREATRLGSVGRPREAVEIAIADESGARLGAGEKGEILARSLRPHVFFDGYWRKPDITAATVRDGWLHTGDRGWMDGDGYLYFDGRVKELIRRGGEMISPVEIELQLMKHPKVRDCAVFAVPDEILGEEIKAMVVSSQGLEASEVRSFLTGRLPDHMLPRYVSFIEAVPKTETQKVKRHELAGLSARTFDVAPRREAGKGGRG